MNPATAAAGVSLLLQLIEQAARVSTVVRQAQAENRDLTYAELAALATENDSARTLLVSSIARAQAEGR